MRMSQDQYYLQMVKTVACRSTCARRRVGAIITDIHGSVLATGYNGVPKGFHHCIDTPCAGIDDPKGQTSRCLAVHAEINALMQCVERDRANTMYISCSSCFDCAKAIANTNIRHIVCLEPYTQEGLDVLERAGIRVSVLKTTQRSGECPLCNTYREKLQRDHIVPKWKGGTDTPENIQYICANCHEDKSAREASERTRGKPSPLRGRISPLLGKTQPKLKGRVSPTKGKFKPRPNCLACGEPCKRTNTVYCSHKCSQARFKKH